jgi:hypothetical protein
MTIRENILKVKKRILEDVVSDDKSFSEDIQNKAIAAILNGPASTQWEIYMTMFIDQVDPAKTEQLRRLTGKDGTAGVDDLDRARAYLVADGPCTPDTSLNFGKFSLNRLDIGLNDNPAPVPQPSDE